MNKLYHTGIFLPQYIRVPNGMWTLEYTGHALREANNDKNGQLTLPKWLDTRKCTLIEVEVDEQKRIQKLVYRTKMSLTTDLTLAIIPLTRGWLVKSVWGNEVSDTHRTLNTSRYARD